MTMARFDEVTSRPVPAPVDVAVEFLTGSRALSAEQRAQLHRRGVPDSAIDHDPDREGGPIRFARVVFEQGFFKFASEDEPEAILAYVTVAGDWRGYASDIVAFDLSGRSASWIGRETLLGAHHVLAPRFDEPLRLFPDPRSWLCGGRDGVVILDWRRAAAELEGLTLAVDDVAFGRTLRQRLTRRPPPIVVRNNAKAAA